DLLCFLQHHETRGFFTVVALPALLESSYRKTNSLSELCILHTYTSAVHFAPFGISEDFSFYSPEGKNLYSSMADIFCRVVLNFWLIGAANAGVRKYPRKAQQCDA